jgi:hypothetical protein
LDDKTVVLVHVFIRFGGDHRSGDLPGAHRSSLVRTTVADGIDVVRRADDSHVAALDLDRTNSVHGEVFESPDEVFGLTSVGW